MRGKRTWRRMYGVSCKRVGLISGTLAFSRKEAIDLFTPFGRWEEYKRDGYRTVVALVKLVEKRTQTSAQ